MTCNFKWISKLSLISLVLCMLLVSLVACSVGPTVPTEPSSTSSSTSSSTTSSSATTTVRPSPQYTITFDGNNPAGYIEEVVVFEGQTVTPPTPPQKENATFLGWYLGEEAFDFSTPITENLTLVAKWKENVYYTVTFKDGDTILSTQQVLENTNVNTPKSPEKENHTFLGWYLGEEAFDFSTPVNENLTLVAKWKENVYYTVTFKDGDTILSTEQVLENTNVNTPKSPEKENHTFIGWYLGEEAFDFSTPVNENLELVAKWKENVYYTVTFKDGDTILSTQQVLENTSAKAPEAPQKPGYIFAGWDKAFDKVTSNLVISTTYNVITYTVTFDTVGGTSIPSITVGEGGTVSRPADPVRAGYEFVEWQLAGLPYTFGTPVTCDITLVAVYKSNGTIPAPTTSEVFIDTEYLEMWKDTTLAYQLRTYQYNGDSKTEINFISTNIAFDFISSDVSICTLTPDGSITAHGIGTAKVYAVVTREGSMTITDSNVDGGTYQRTLTLPVGTVLAAVDVKVIDQPDYYKLAQSADNQKITLNSGEFPINPADFAAYPTGGYGSGNISLWYGDTECVFTMTVDDNIMSDFNNWNLMYDKYNIPSTFCVISRFTHEVAMRWREQVAYGQSVQPHGHFHMASSTYDDNPSTSKIWMDFYYGAKDIVTAGVSPALIMGYPCGYNDPNLTKMLFIAGRGTGGHVNNGANLNYNCLGSFSGFGSKILSTMENVSNGTQLGAWLSVHYHQIGDLSVVENYMSQIAQYMADGYVWAATFPAAAQYGQERDTATLTVLSADANVMTFSLTDKMNDLLFDHPLTIRLKADSTWQAARAYQNGKEMPVKIVTHNGETYLLVDAIPDKGEVTVVRTNIENLTQTPTKITYNLTDTVGAYNQYPLTLSFTVDGSIWQNAYAMQGQTKLPAALKTVNGVTTLTVTAMVNAGEVTIVPVTTQYVGRTYLTMTEVYRGEVTPDGTLPITISSPEELVMFSAYVGAGHDCTGLTITLEADLDMRTVANFDPIGWELLYEKSSGGYYARPFSGTFDGKNHTISHLTIQSDYCMVGLFGYMKNASVSNINVNGNVSGMKRVGGIAGHAVLSTMTNCIFTGTVTNYGLDAHPNTGSMTGGIVGAITSTNISHCAAYAIVTSYAPSAKSAMYTDASDSFSSGNYTGGIVGRTYTQTNLTNGDSIIDNCVFEGTVTAHKAPDGRGALYVGGFIGIMDTVKIYNCTATANVKGAMYVGGFAGMQDGSTRDAYMYNCSAHGTVTGEDYVGGLIGYLYGSRRATNHNSFTDAVVICLDESATYVGAVFGALRAGNQNPAPIVYYIPSVNGSMQAYYLIENEGGIQATCTLNAVATPEEALPGLNAFAASNGYQTWIIKNGSAISSHFPIYTVTFMGKDGEILSVESVADGMDATPPTPPTYQGYIFESWDKSFVAVSDNLVVNALYTQVETHIVTFYAEDGHTVLATVVVNDGMDATAPTPPDLDGKLFSGWSVSFTAVTTDLTVVAQYQTAYTVTFLGKDGETLSAVKVVAGQTVTAPEAPTIYGFRFIGWDTSLESISANTTIKAQYEELILHTVTFLGKNGENLKTEIVEDGASAIPPTPTSYEGFRFTGWDKAYDTVKGDLTVTATYVQVIDQPVSVNVQSWHVAGDHKTAFAGDKMNAFYAMWGTADVVLYTGTYGVSLPSAATGWAQQSFNVTYHTYQAGIGLNVAYRTDKFTFDTNAGVFTLNGTTKWMSDMSALAVPLVDNATGKQIIVVSVYFGNASKIHESNRMVNSLKSILTSMTTQYPDASAIVMNMQTQSSASGAVNQGLSNYIAELDAKAWISGYDMATLSEYQIKDTAYSRYVVTYLKSDTTVTISNTKEIATTGDYATQNGNSYTLVVD